MKWLIRLRDPEPFEVEADTEEAALEMAAITYMPNFLPENFQADPLSESEEMKS